MKRLTDNCRKNIFYFSSALLIILSVFVLTSCGNTRKQKTADPNSFISVTAQAETKPVPRALTEDSADDPAIWINYSEPDSSYIVGTDKKGGLAVYDLSGREKFYYNTGFMNNADIRYKFPLASDTADILAVSNRTDQSVDLFRINNDGSLEIINNQQLKSMLKEEVYGLCMYQSKITGKYFVFVNGKDGAIEQWELSAHDNKIDGKIVRNLKLKTQTEGMVADDETGTLYVGEEDKGIWKFNAEPSASDSCVLIPLSGEKENSYITSDIEGLAIYKLPSEEGYLIASSQGNSSYAVFDRKPPHKYLGSFKIVSGTKIDGVEETDGLDVVNFNFGDKYPDGLFVVQDGTNSESGAPASQNFKIVRWDSIAIKFNPQLVF